VVRLNYCIRLVCLLTASIMATHALSQDMSGWSDKTVCRLVKNNGGQKHIDEATRRGLSCKAPIKPYASTLTGSNGWEKVPIPDYVDKKTKSPWNIHDNFEDGRLRFNYINNGKNISNSPGIKPYKFKQDPDGNTYLEITVKHKWNTCCHGASFNSAQSGKREFYSERAEIYPVPSPAREKIIWYGFKVRLPKDFIHIDDRVMFSQFFNGFKGMKKGPLFKLSYYDKGKRLLIGGDTGGVAHSDLDSGEKRKYGIQLDYYLRDKKRSRAVPKYKYVSGLLTFDATPLGEWTTYKVGIYNTKKDRGFVKVYKDNDLVFDYKGATFDWIGSYTESLIRIGLYRNSDPSGKGYPDQVMHYDDFTIVSDKQTLDKYLN